MTTAANFTVSLRRSGTRMLAWRDFTSEAEAFTFALRVADHENSGELVCIRIYRRRLGRWAPFSEIRPNDKRIPTAADLRSVAWDEPPDDQRRRQASSWEEPLADECGVCADVRTGDLDPDRAAAALVMAAIGFAHNPRGDSVAGGVSLLGGRTAPWLAQLARPDDPLALDHLVADSCHLLERVIADQADPLDMDSLVLHRALAIVERIGDA